MKAWGSTIKTYVSCDMPAGTDPDPEVNTCMASLADFMDERVVGAVNELDYAMQPEVGEGVEPDNRFGPTVRTYCLIKLFAGQN